MNNQSGSVREIRHAARKTWLENYPHLADLPGATSGVITITQRAALEAARLLMVAAGLYTGTSEPKATRWGIRLVVSEIRGESLKGVHAGRYNS